MVGCSPALVLRYQLKKFHLIYKCFGFGFLFGLGFLVYGAELYGLGMPSC